MSLRGLSLDLSPKSRNRESMRNLAANSANWADEEDQQEQEKQAA